MSALSNADFRNIFATETSSKAPQKRPHEGGGGGDGGGHKKKPNKGKFIPAHLRKKEEDAGSEYKDRAKERRLGVSSEYAISEDAVKDLTVEESKYLGGDMEHTHLVKGLDFALLAKIRSEMEEQEYGEEAMDEKMKAKHKESEALAARSALGSAVKTHLMKEAKQNKPVELFLQGRTTFVFSLDEDFGDIPTTKSKSIEDLPAAAREYKTGNTPKSIMQSVSTIMTYIRQGSRPASKKVKRKQVLEEAEKRASAPKVPDDDIFDDAGSYDLTMRASEKAAKAPVQAARRPPSPDNDPPSPEGPPPQ